MFHTFVAATFVLGIAFGQIECGSNSVAIDWSLTSSSSSVNRSASWESDYNSTQCRQSTCGAYSYDIDRTITSAQFPSFERSRSYSVDAAFCGRDRICQLFAGGPNHCYAVNYDYQLWYPQSCDNSSDYDATYVDYNITYQYACCNTTECNEDYDFGSNCEFDVDLGNYVNGLYDCWNDVKRDVMKYLICDDDGNRIYEFESNCKNNSGLWRNSRGRGDYNCTLTRTCSDTWQQILQTFGDCACEVYIRIV